MRHLGVVVRETDGGKRACRKHRNPHKAIAQIGPQKSRNNDRDHNQQSSHRGSSGLFLVSFGTFFADVLPDLEITQAPDHQRPHNQSSEQRGQAGKRSAKRDVPEDTEGRDVMLQLEE